MTRADSAHALRMSLDSTLTPGQGQAPIMPSTPLPKGWGSFLSTPDSNLKAHFYAVSPYPVDALRRQYGSEANGLLSTVHAETWTRLHLEVQAQIRLYKRLIGGAQ
ncbi:hypothetical protein RKD49_005419 [Streptomyces glaucescens]